jgi:hypothetical protein
MKEGQMFYKGDRVSTKLGTGTVAYVRMAPPDYATVEAVSVRLDKKMGGAYTGTILSAADVTALDPATEPTMKIRELFMHPLPGTRLDTPLGPATMRGVVTDPKSDHFTATHYHVYLDTSRTVITKVAAGDCKERT